jgi:SAM-dependent methyltransferase
MGLLNRVRYRLFGHRFSSDAVTAKAVDGREIVYKSPPMTVDLVKAIKLITPDMKLHADEVSRRDWENDQNASSWAEMDILSPLLSKIPKPGSILEIGPGFGRSVVFFTKKMGWSGAQFDLFEGNGTRTKYTIGGPKFEDSFCGNIALLKELLAYNGIDSYRILDAADHGYKLANINEKYDVIYSFYAVGFHWSLEHFLDEILALLKESGIAFFTVPYNFEPFASLAKAHYTVLEGGRTATERVNILVLSKHPIPSLGRGA